jgi:hypothetical protein
MKIFGSPGNMSLNYDVKLGNVIDFRFQPSPSAHERRRPRSSDATELLLQRGFFSDFCLINLNVMSCVE